MDGALNLFLLLLLSALMSINIFNGVTSIARAKIESAATCFAVASFILPVAVYYAIICGR